MNNYSLLILPLTRKWIVGWVTTVTSWVFKGSSNSARAGLLTASSLGYLGVQIEGKPNQPADCNIGNFTHTNSINLILNFTKSNLRIWQPKKQGLVKSGVGKCPDWTSHKSWGCNLQQILEGDVPNPQKGTFTTGWCPPVISWLINSIDYIVISTINHS